jgi:hypothetical protein
MVVLEEDEKVDLTAVYSSAMDILEATEAVLEEMRQWGGIDLTVIGPQPALLAALLIIPGSINILLALPVAILAWLYLLSSQAQYCAFQARLCPSGGWIRLFLWPLCIVWSTIESWFIVETVLGSALRAATTFSILTGVFSFGLSVGYGKESIKECVTTIWSRNTMNFFVIQSRS